MTASLKAARMGEDDAKPMAENMVDAWVSLERRCAKLAVYVLEAGEPIKAGQLAVMATLARQCAAHMDGIAAHINSRPLREALHGVREATEQQTDTQQQMQLLQDQGP